MNEITVFNLEEVNRGVFKATVSVNLGNGIVLHECKIIERDGELRASPAQRTERKKGGIVVHYDFIEFENKDLWPKIEEQILKFYGSK